MSSIEELERFENRLLAVACIFTGVVALASVATIVYALFVEGR